MKQRSRARQQKQKRMLGMKRCEVQSTLEIVRGGKIGKRMIEFSN
jgi:hypothetical protein